MLKHAVLFLQGGSVESRISQLNVLVVQERATYTVTSIAVMSRQAAWSDCEECRGLHILQMPFYRHQERKANF